MCNPHSSSQFLIEENIIMGAKVNQKNYNWNPSAEEKLLSILNSGKSFVLRGGEPFVVPFLKKMLAQVTERKELLITTNVTRFDDEWLEILSRHKIKMCLSLDAYQDLNHYIRFPSDWQAIIKNIESMSKIPGVNIFVNTCVQNLNILYLDKLLEWAVNDKNLFVHLDVLTKPPIFEPRNLPDSLLKEARKRLIMCRARLKPKMVEGLDSIIDSLTTNDTTHWKEFVDVVKKRDAHRGIRVTDYLPELELYFHD
jgi:sulfatase maturation enzyme AslB (radical SAM superfamily)